MIDISRKIKDKINLYSKKELSKNNNIYKDKGWYVSKMTRYTIYIVMCFAFFIVSIMLANGNLTNESVDLESWPLVVCIIMLIISVLFFLYFSWRMFITKFTYDKFSKESNNIDLITTFDETKAKEKAIKSSSKKKTEENKDNTDKDNKK